MLESEEGILVAQLVFFAISVPLSIYVTIRHGLDAIHGWFFIFIFCVVRIAGAALLLHADLDDAFTETGSILYNVALAPLFFAVSGVLQEASISVARIHPRLLGTTGMWSIHIAVAVGIALLIAGAVLIVDKEETGTADISNYLHLVQAGAAVFLVLIFIMGAVAVYSFLQPRRVAAERRLITAVVAAIPLLGLRTLYAFLGSVINSSSWSFLTGGTLAEQVILNVIPEFLLILLLVGAGLVTRDLVRERKASRDSQHHSGSHPLVHNS